MARRTHSSSLATDAGIAVAVAGRPALYREALARVLAAEPKVSVVGHAAQESVLARLLRRERPKVLLFDYEAFGPAGEEAIARLRRAGPQTRILVLATRSGPETVEKVLAAGASGLVAKELDLKALLRAIRAVARGEIWANRLATARALESLSGLPGLSRGPVGSDSALTHREAEIVEQVALGLRNKEIAAALTISEKTVRAHLNNIFQKLRLDNRTALALLARDASFPHKT